jgi:hypothetical protein
LSIHPNPSRDQVGIHFQLDDPANVVIQLMDLSGRVVASIHEGKLQSGSYNFQVGDDLHAGVYVLRFLVDDGMLTEKIILTK